MTNTFSRLALTGLVVAAVACGGRDADANRKEAQYETVEEGQAAGVTSTINAPGETIPPMTGTNADTTSAFTINPAVASNATPPGTLAGTLPTQPYGGAGYIPPTPNAGAPAQTSIPRPMTSASSQPTYIPAPQRSEEAVPTSTQAEPVNTAIAAPPTDTVTPPPPPQTQTDTAPPPAKQEQEESEPEQTETEAPPPPPPPPAASAR